MKDRILKLNPSKPETHPEEDGGHAVLDTVGGCDDVPAERWSDSPGDFSSVLITLYHSSSTLKTDFL